MEDLVPKNEENASLTGSAMSKSPFFCETGTLAFTGEAFGSEGLVSEPKMLVSAPRIGTSDLTLSVLTALVATGLGVTTFFCCGFGATFFGATFFGVVSFGVVGVGAVGFGAVGFGVKNDPRAFGVGFDFGSLAFTDLVTGFVEAILASASAAALRASSAASSSNLRLLAT